MIFENVFEFKKKKFLQLNVSKLKFKCKQQKKKMPPKSRKNKPGPSSLGRALMRDRFGSTNTKDASFAAVSDLKIDGKK